MENEDAPDGTDRVRGGRRRRGRSWRTWSTRFGLGLSRNNPDPSLKANLGASRFESLGTRGRFPFGGFSDLPGRERWFWRHKEE